MRILLSIILVFIGTNIFAEKFTPAKLIFNDGRIIKGYSKQPGFKDNVVVFKPSLDDKKQEISSHDLKTIILYDEQDTLEFEQVLTLRFYSKSKVIGPFWMFVLQRGFATLYTYYVGGHSYMSSNGWHSMPGDRYFSCIRENENHATIISAAMDTGVNNNTYFKKTASKYFSDNTGLASKISNKEYKYKDIMEVVIEYNRWKSGENRK